MNKFKKAAISVMTAALLGCSALGFAACGGDYPDYKNPDDKNPTVTPGTGGYTVNVKSEGGLNLDGVMVHAKKNGQTVATGYSKNGKINFDIPTDNYELVVDQNSLPTGYSVPDGAQYNTPENGNEISIYLPSKIIETTVDSGVTYSVGQVINTFSFVDTDGERHTLTELAKGKKLVVLNFWATWCGPCKSEFPALKEAYEHYKDVVEVIALSTTDNISLVRTFRDENNLNFYMGEDSSSIYSHFTSNGIPLTVFIDRYGVIANIHNGSITTTSQWAGLFSNYTSDYYVQSPEQSGGEGDAFEREKPNIASPDPEDLARASVSTDSNEGKFSDFGEDMSESDKEYNWPWIPQMEGDREYLSATNIGKKESYSIFTAKVKMNSGDILSFDYKLRINSDDVFAVILDNVPVARFTGETSGWVTESTAYVATHDIEAQLVVAYKRSIGAKLAGEIAAIDNLKIIHASEAGVSVDIPVALVSGNLQANGKYETYGEVYLDENDGFYHEKETGNLVVADIRNATMWTEHVSGKKFTATDEVEYTSTLYQIAYYLMSNYQQVDSEKAISLVFDFGHTDNLIENYYLQMFSETEYVPVTKDLMETIVAFAQAYCEKYDKEYYGEQWLEFCYIFKHYGGEHKEGEVCYETADPTAGRARHNAFTAVEDELIKVNINHTSTYEGGGMYYKFTPAQSGVYKFVSSENVYVNELGDTVSTDPAMLVEDENGETLYYFDDDRSYDKLYSDENLVGYGWLEAGKTYYLHCIMGYIGEAGKYSVKASCIGQSFDHMVSCSDGSWASQEKFNTVKVALGADGYYHHVDEDGNLQSLIYLDFLHSNYFDNNEHSILEMANNGLFNMIATFGLDFTADILDYYSESVEGKQPTDELYGLLPVNEDLCDILVLFAKSIALENDDKSSGYWLAACCYKQHYGV